MEYWSEKCPNCGYKTRKSSLNNEKTFGSPLIKCENCGGVYIHPDRIEIGLFTEKELKAFKNKMMFSFIWRIVFLSIVVGLLLQYLLLDRFLQTDWAFLPISVAISLLGYFKIKTSVERTIRKEMDESMKRLNFPGYREVLEKSGYKPRWST